MSQLFRDAETCTACFFCFAYLQMYCEWDTLIIWRLSSDERFSLVHLAWITRPEKWQPEEAALDTQTSMQPTIETIRPPSTPTTVTQLHQLPTLADSTPHEATEETTSTLYHHNHRPAKPTHQSECDSLDAAPPLPPCPRWLFGCLLSRPLPPTGGAPWSPRCR